MLIRTATGSAGLVTTVASPPWASATARTIARPRPVPPPVRPSSARLKRSKARLTELGREALAPVAHLQDHRAGFGAGRETDRARAVAQGVVDQVAQGLLDAQRVEIGVRTGPSRDGDLAPHTGSPERRTGRAHGRAAPGGQPAVAQLVSGPGRCGRSPAGPRRGGRGGQPPRRSTAAPPEAPRASGPAAPPAPARLGGSRAACAAHGSHRRRMPAHARASPRCRSSIWFRVSPNRWSSSSASGRGSRSPLRSRVIPAARRRIDSTGAKARPART